VKNSFELRAAGGGRRVSMTTSCLQGEGGAQKRTPFVFEFAPPKNLLDLFQHGVQHGKTPMLGQ